MGIFSIVYNSFFTFFQGLISIFQGFILSVIFSTENSIISIEIYWGSNYGIWMPLVLVISIGMSFVGMFLVFSLFGAGRALVGD